MIIFVLNLHLFIKILKTLLWLIILDWDCFSICPPIAANGLHQIDRWLSFTIAIIYLWVFSGRWNWRMKITPMWTMIIIIIYPFSSLWLLTRIISIWAWWFTWGWCIMTWGWSWFIMTWGWFIMAWVWARWALTWWFLMWFKNEESYK